MNISQIILKPVLTEKSVRGTASSKYTFEVHASATKVDVKQALLKLYGVNVDKVNILKGFPKYRWGRGRRPMQKRGMTRKAIVTLKAGEKLDISKPKTTTSNKSKSTKKSE